MEQRRILDEAKCWYKETETGDYVISLAQVKDYPRILGFENELKYHPPSVVLYHEKDEERFRDYDYWTSNTSLLIVEKHYFSWAAEVVGVGFFDNMISDEYDTYPPNLDFYGILPYHRRRVRLGFAVGMMFFGLKAVENYYKWGISVQSPTRGAVISNIKDWTKALNLGLRGNIDDGIDFEFYLREHVEKDYFIRRCETILKSQDWRPTSYPYESRMRPVFGGDFTDE